MEHMTWKLENYNPNKEKYNTQRTSTPFRAREFYIGRKMIHIAFENGIFLLPKQYSIRHE